MNYNVEKRLKQIKDENNIWIIYLGIIGLSYIANHYEKEFFLTNNIRSKEKYRKINAFIFTVLIIVYAYFEKDALSSFNNKNKTIDQEKYDVLILFATTSILISGLIFLYIILEDTNLKSEIAFN